MLPGLALISAMVSSTLFAQEAPKPVNPEYPDFYTGEKGNSLKGIDFVQSISVSSPAYCSEIKGDVTITFKAPNMTEVKALCWQQPTKELPDPWGHDADVAPDLKLDADANGSFVFHADQFPNGPITIRIYAKNAKKTGHLRASALQQGWRGMEPGRSKDSASSFQRNETCLCR